jgi:hypothetical protein
MSWSQSDTTAAETVAYAESIRESKDPETYHLDKALYHLNKLGDHLQSVPPPTASTDKYSQMRVAIEYIQRFRWV